jgi:cyclophilin family peptidyl-prolyl cis-trans isomerase
LKAEFTSTPFVRGVVGMARSQSPNSANSQFFIMFGPTPSLDGQYTVIGQVTSGMENVDKLKKGSEANNGSVSSPDKILTARVAADKQ